MRWGGRGERGEVLGGVRGGEGVRWWKGYRGMYICNSRMEVV